MKLEKVKTLEKLLNLQKKDIIIVVGSNGKTSFCLNLCEELKEKNENIIFFSTTTKIYDLDKKYKFEKLYFENIKNNFLENNFDNYKIKIENIDYKKGVYVFGEKKEEKINSLPLILLEKLENKCDYFILEGDGSKEKPLKGWNKTEPVYIEGTTKSVGIIPINIIGKKIEDKNIHRMEKFIEITGEKINNVISVNTLYNIIINENGLFQYSKGEKILLVNCVENENDKKNFIKLYEKLKKEKINLKIFGVSLKNKNYYKINYEE